MNGVQRWTWRMVVCSVCLVIITHALARGLIEAAFG